MAVSLATYEQVALEDGDTTWEYVCGQLREKPGMTQEHNATAGLLSYLTQSQLSLTQFRVVSNASRLRTPSGNAYVPDVVVLPRELARSKAGTRELETYDEPLPFVAEIWSPSTGAYDIDTKIPDYLARGDSVVWRVHPYDRAGRAWTRQPGGEYAVSDQTGGTVAIASLPGVSIDLVVLFD